MMREKNMPKYCFRRKDSPFIWYAFKVNGKLYTGSTETDDKKTAEDFVAKERGQAVEGKIRERAPNMLLAEVIHTVLDKRRATDAYRRSVLNVVESPVMEGKKVPGHKPNGVEPEDIVEYHLWRSKRASESTVNREIGYFQSCVNYAIKKLKMALVDPVKAAEWERFDEDSVARDRIFTFEERAKLFGDAKFALIPKQVAVFALQTGMRKGEILAAKWQHVNWADRVLKVKTLKKKKRGAVSDPYRYVPISQTALEILKQRRAEGWEKRSDYLFCDENGGKLSRHGQVTTAFEFACVRNKIEDLRFHDLRHNFATDFLRANKDVKAIKALSEIMGHSEERITKRYTHLWPEDKNNQVALLPPVPGFQVGQTQVAATTHTLR